MKRARCSPTPRDDHTLGVFDKAIQSKTDQFLIRYRKP